MSESGSPRFDSPRVNVAVLISGGGTTLRNLIEHHSRGDLPVDFRLAISSNPAAGGLRFAHEAGIRSLVIQRRDFPDVANYSEAVFGACRDAEAQLVVMAGFLKLVRIPEDFTHRVLNIHPALIPAFCGRGFYGQRVHAAVLEYGAKISGCTVHFVDNQYDHGPIILQQAVPVADDDTPETLAQRVFQQECEAYPRVIRWFAEGRLRVEGRQVRLD